MSQMYAHSRSPVTGRWHMLEDHLRGSAALAKAFGEVFGCGALAEYLALVHDVGKGTCAWQAKLRQVDEQGGGRVGIRHKHAGTWLAARYLPRQFGAVVHGHHGGLPDMEWLREELLRMKMDPREKAAVDEAIRRVEQVVPEIHPSPSPAPPQWLKSGPAPERVLGMDLLMRMVFSCVVDADYLDTNAHFNGEKPRVRPAADMDALVARYERRRERLLAEREPSPVDAIRQDVYEQACAAAAGEPGMYVLHVPTGGAKTIASGGFALRHAARHGLGRVVMAVPYISITQQNAGVYRQLLDPPPEDGEAPVVLEHHSAVDVDREEDKRSLSPEQRAEAEARERMARLAAENWDAPFVITTTVQLFESLFSSKPSAMRKLHRLARSVIVLDEVQALPDRLLIPILSGLRGLVEHFGASVLLASATQPSFWSLERLDGLARRSVIADPRWLFDRLRRVEYRWLLGEDVTLESVAAEVASHRQVLAILNTTVDAAVFHRLVEEHSDDDATVLHLSTRMTAAHRREVIDEIRGLLKEGRPVRVVSTQLVEAGVDLDFPEVYRAWAPVESMQQAAGRCNRDGRLPTGRVTIFRPKDGRQPRDAAYRAALAATDMFFGPDRAAPDDLDALERYYPRRYAFQRGAPGSGLGAEIENLRRKLDFPEVHRRFQMIEEGRVHPVVVIRREADREAIEDAVARLRSAQPCGPEVLRSLQPHTASLPRHEAAAAVRHGLADPVVGDLLLWRGTYHERRGLDPMEPEDLDQYNL